MVDRFVSKIRNNDSFSKAR